MLCIDFSKPDWALPEPAELIHHEASFGIAMMPAMVTAMSPIPITKMPASSPPLTSIPHILSK